MGENQSVKNGNPKQLMRHLTICLLGTYPIHTLIDAFESPNPVQNGKGNYDFGH